MNIFASFFLSILLFHSHGVGDRPAYFVAMEYKGLSNCIYKVYITDSLILGAKVNGYISAEPTMGIGKAIPKNVMQYPEAWVDKTMDAKYENSFSDQEKFLGIDKENFIIRTSDIKKIYHNSKPKWGMGYYAYTGRVVIEAKKTPENRKAERELILVGYQFPPDILKLLNASAYQEKP
jgi:hypothetical protein